MQVSTGNLYPSTLEAFKAGVKADDLVLLSGPPEAIEAVSERVRLGAREQANRKARRAAQKKARRRNRG